MPTATASGAYDAAPASTGAASLSAQASGSYTAAPASSGGVSASASGSYTAKAASASASTAGSYVASANGGLALRTGLATNIPVQLWRRTGLASEVNVGATP